MEGLNSGTIKGDHLQIPSSAKIPAASSRAHSLLCSLYVPAAHQQARQSSETHSTWRASQSLRAPLPVLASLRRLAVRSSARSTPISTCCVARNMHSIDHDRFSHQALWAPRAGLGRSHAAISQLGAVRSCWRFVPARNPEETLTPLSGLR